MAVMTKVLVIGMSGTGKSSALAELGRRGHAVVDTDEPGWMEWVDAPDEAWGGEWLWVEERMAALLSVDDNRTLFVSGCVRNQGQFLNRFDAVVLLITPVDVILERVTHRTTNSYGHTSAERRMIRKDVATVEPLLRASCTHELDATRPLEDVVVDLVAIAASADAVYG